MKMIVFAEKTCFSFAVCSLIRTFAPNFRN